MNLDDLDRQVRMVLTERYHAEEHKRELWFLCPAHDETEPSAAYHLEKRIWYCQGCHRGGGLIGGDLPLAPLLGIAVDRIDAGELERLRQERSEVATALKAAEQRKHAALVVYWREHQEVVRLRERLDVLDGLIAEGVPALACDHFGFHVADWYGHESLGIPWTVRGEIRALQYRLLGNAAPGGRYRWYPGGRPTLFNADAILEPTDDTMVVVEGAKKAAALWGHGITSVCAVVSKGAWCEEYAPPFARFGRVVFALDPDALAEATAAAKTVPGARVARLPMKPDDLLVATGGDVDALWSYIENARACD